MGCAKTVAIDYQTATRITSRQDFDVTRRSSGIKVIRRMWNPRCEGKWAASWKTWAFLQGSKRTMVEDLTGNCPRERGGFDRQHLKIYWDDSNRQTPDVQDVHAAQVPLAHRRFSAIARDPAEAASTRSIRFAPRSMTGPYARAAGNYTRYAMFRFAERLDDRLSFLAPRGLKLDLIPSSFWRCRPMGSRLFLYADWLRKGSRFLRGARVLPSEPSRHSLLRTVSEGKDNPAMRNI